jgi:hypothetical protein
MSIGDLINAGMLLIASGSLIYTARGVRQQATASDFSSYLQLMERLSKAWRAYGDARAAHSAEPATRNPEEFEFLELMNILEMACHLHKKRILLPATREMLCDHLKEVLPAIYKNEDTKKMIDEHLSGPDTFFYIRRFAREHRLEDVPQQ